MPATATRKHQSPDFAAIRPGDRVKIVTKHQSVLSGRAVMRTPDGGWVLNGGGRHGTPLLAYPSNVVAVIPSKRKHGG
jgi:hypothetical protein